MAEHIYEFQGTWEGAMADGFGVFRSGALSSKFSIPADMQGMGEGTNPEDLLLSASGCCYLITLAAILRFQRVRAQDINLKSKGVFDMTENGPVLKKIEHFPEVTVAADAFEKVQEAIHASFKMAEEGCMVSQAVKGNVEIRVTGTIHQA